jgi:hypothetical protein
MAFAGMSPGYPDTVCALAQGGHKKLGVHPAGAGNANYPDVGWIFHPPNPCKVGSTIAAPVAQKGNNFGFPIGHVYYSFFWLLDACFWLWLFVLNCSQLPVPGRQQPDANGR